MSWIWACTMCGGYDRHFENCPDRWLEPAPPEPQRAERQASEILARSRDGWRADAEREAHNVIFWRERAEKAEAELREVQSKLWEALGALGYPVPGDTPCPPRYECGTCGPNKQWAMKAEAEAKTLRARIEKLEQLIRETLSRRSKSREHKFAMPTECGTWDRMEALLSESEQPLTKP